MIADNEKNLLLHAFADFESVEDLNGDPGASFIVSLDPVGLADVVEKQNQVENARAGVFAENFAVVVENLGSAIKNPVKFAHCAEDVNVGSVAVIVFVLHLAGKAPELGYESTEDTEIVHFQEGWIDLPVFLEDGTKAGGGRRRINDPAAD